MSVEPLPHQIRLIVAFDNKLSRPDLQSGWGFACVVQTSQTLGLFDTGVQGDSLLANLNALSIPVENLRWIVISHDHYDHTGGLATVLQANPSVPVFLAAEFSEATKNIVTSAGGTLMLTRGSTQIAPGVHTIGPLGTRIREQSLAVKTADGIVIVTGCSHPGLTSIVRTARDLWPNENILLVMGGFHLGDASQKAISQLIHELQQLEVRQVGPAHCTGEKATQMFKEAYGDNCLDVGTGAVFTFPEAA